MDIMKYEWNPLLDYNVTTAFVFYAFNHSANNEIELLFVN